jgi:hypothetical protein
MTQIFPPLARDRDALSSHEAAGSAGDAIKNQRARVLLAVNSYAAHGMTSRELSEYNNNELELDRYQVARRLSDLHNLGLVRRVEGGKFCPITKKLAIAWFPLKGQMKLF